jgi:hypothetical protein
VRTNGRDYSPRLVRERKRVLCLLSSKRRGGHQDDDWRVHWEQRLDGCSQSRRDLTIAIKRIMSQEIDRRKWKILRLGDLDRGGGIDLGENHRVQSIALRPRKQMGELEREKRHAHARQQ